MKLLKVLTLTASLLLSNSVLADWTYNESIDVMTDKNSSYIYNRSLTKGHLNRSSGLMLSVFGGITFSGDRYYSNKTVSVRYRFDKATVTEWLNARTSSKGDGFYFGVEDKQAFTDGLAEFDNLILQVMDFRGTIHTYKFNTVGFNEAFKHIESSYNSKLKNDLVKLEYYDIAKKGRYTTLKALERELRLACVKKGEGDFIECGKKAEAESSAKHEKDLADFFKRNPDFKL